MPGTAIQDAWTVLAGVTAAMAWFNRHADDPGDVHDDDLVAASHEFVLDAVNDKDTVWLIKTVTGKDILDQVSANDANDMRVEADLRKMGAKRN